MKTKKVIGILVLFSILFSSGINQSFSQDRMIKKEKREMMKEKNQKNQIPDLTEEQEARIKELRVNFAKETKKLRNEIKELKAHLNTLKAEEKANMDKINKQIDLINEQRTILEKEKAAMEQEIRKLLTVEQKLFFDEHNSKKDISNKRPVRKNPHSN